MDRLTRDCIAARLHGMTYGKYKAMQGYTEIKAREEIDTTKVKFCRKCGKPFTPGKHYRVYCSTECRNK